MCSRVPVRAVAMCVHLGVDAHACLSACMHVRVHAGGGEAGGGTDSEIQTEDFGKGLTRIWPWWRRRRPAAELPNSGKNRKFRLGVKEAFLRNRKQQISTS